MARDYGPVVWPSWNTEFGADFDKKDCTPPTDHAAVYEAMRADEKQRAAEKDAQS